MNKKLKKALQNAFEPPKPIHEKEFIKQFPQPTISTLSFVLSQIKIYPKVCMDSFICSFFNSSYGS